MAACANKSKCCSKHQIIRYQILQTPDNLRTFPRAPSPVAPNPSLWSLQFGRKMPSNTKITKAQHYISLASIPWMGQRTAAEVSRLELSIWSLKFNLIGFNMSLLCQLLEESCPFKTRVNLGCNHSGVADQRPQKHFCPSRETETKSKRGREVNFEAEAVVVAQWRRIRLHQIRYLF